MGNPRSYAPQPNPHQQLALQHSSQRGEFESSGLRSSMESQRFLFENPFLLFADRWLYLRRSPPSSCRRRSSNPRPRARPLLAMASYSMTSRTLCHREVEIPAAAPRATRTLQRHRALPRARGRCNVRCFDPLHEDQM